MIMKQNKSETFIQRLQKLKRESFHSKYQCKAKQISNQCKGVKKNCVLESDFKFLPRYTSFSCSLTSAFELDQLQAVLGHLLTGEKHIHQLKEFKHKLQQQTINNCHH